MKSKKIRSAVQGFTLMELMVAMVITMIIVGVLVTITGTAADTWNRGRSELRAARQAKAMVDVMANDFESIVVRSNTGTEWLSAAFDIPTEGGSSNASYLVFYTATTDRYDGKIGVDGVDLGGDVCCVGYQLKWKDPIAGGDTGNFKTFVFNRLLVDPKDAFVNLLGKTSTTDPTKTLAKVFDGVYGAQMIEDKNFLCENIYQFTVTFHVDVSSTSNKQVSVGDNGVKQLRVLGTGVLTDPVDSTLTGGRVTAVEISLSVLTDAGVDMLRKNDKLAEKPEWLAKNTYHYSKLVQLPRM